MVRDGATKSGRMLMCRSTLVWIPKRTYDSCVDEVANFYPLETGGVLMGYWHKLGTAVVTATVGAGPDALHDQHPR